MSHSPTKTVERALDILECFQNNNEGLTLSNISVKLKLSKSTVYRIISTLESRHYLRKGNQNKKYYLGENFIQLAILYHQGKHNVLKEAALPIMKDFFEKYNENVGLFIADEDCKICLERFESTKTLRHIVHIGERITMKKGSVGKVLLAYMTEKERHNLNTDNDWPDEVELLKVKNQGYSLSIGEREEGLIGIATPIFNAKGKCVASLSVSGPTIRIMNDKLDEKTSTLIEAAKIISARLTSL